MNDYATFTPKKLKAREVKEFVSWVRHTCKFGATKRLIWTPYTCERERVSAHSWQLAMIVWYLCAKYLPHLDLLYGIQLSLVHDTPEYSEGDTPSFLDRFGEYVNLPTAIDKHEREARATRWLSFLWKRRFPGFIRALLGYENDIREETRRLVSSVDKLLAEVNILLDEGYTDKRLGVTLEQKIEKKRLRIADHPLVLDLYDQITEFAIAYRSDLFYKEGDERPGPRICPECRAALMAELQQQTPA